MSVLRAVRKRKKVRKLGRVEIMRREDYADLELDAKVELIRSLVPLGLMHVEELLDVVLRLLRGESLEALSREVGVEIYRLEDWRDRAVAGLERGLQARQGDLVAEALDAATRHIGELSMENELLRERARAAEQRRP